MQPQPTNSELLDRLCFFRGLYARRGIDDSEAELTLSVEAAVAYGERLLHFALTSDQQGSAGTPQPTD
jgi:hypothetical protein